MQSQRDLAIVLRSVPYEDRHRIVTALTEHHGQISALAKNSVQSRRFGGSLELFSASDWIFNQKPGSDLCQLSEAEARYSFEGIRQDFQKLALASTTNELMIKLSPQNQPCEELFRLHSNALFALHELTTPENHIVALLNAYLAKLLQWNGNQPQLNHCMQCEISLEQIPSQFELSCMIADAGWICHQCRTQETRHIREREGSSFQHSLLRLLPEAIRDFQLSLKIPIRQIPNRMQAPHQEHIKLFKFLEALFVFHIPGFDRKSMKSLRFLGLESVIPRTGP